MREQLSIESNENVAEFTAERIKNIREFAETAREMGLSPRELLKDKIKRGGAPKEYKDMPGWFKSLYGASDKTIGFNSPSFKEDFMYNAAMGEALEKEGCVKISDKKERQKGKMKYARNRDSYTEFPSASLFLESQSNPSMITDPEKYSQVLKEAEAKFFAENIVEDADLKKMTEELREAGMEGGK